SLKRRSRTQRTKLKVKPRRCRRTLPRNPSKTRRARSQETTSNSRLQKSPQLLRMMQVSARNLWRSTSPMPPRMPLQGKQEGRRRRSRLQAKSRRPRRKVCLKSLGRSFLVLPMRQVTKKIPSRL
ncbi:unnamed protein product, partial [Symbiodinium pilosum]